MKTALSIAGSDSSGGAGIQADLKTMTVSGVFGMSVITALTAQNTMGVSAIFEVPADFVTKQLDAVFADMPVDAVKVGMVASEEIICAIADALTKYCAKNIVVDPVMVATSGSKLIATDAVRTLTHKLFPIASLVTPNIPEAEVLSGMKIATKWDMEVAAEFIARHFGTAVLCKGGHFVNDANDLLYADGKRMWIKGKRIANPNTHGTGCTLSSAIASNLAKGAELYDAVVAAKEYISGALGAMLDLGHGSGPMNHAYCLKNCE